MNTKNEAQKDSILEKIAKKSPNKLADDDHLYREDISESDFDKGCEELKKKFGLKSEEEKKNEKE